MDALFRGCHSSFGVVPGVKASFWKMIDYDFHLPRNPLAIHQTKPFKSRHCMMKRSVSSTFEDGTRAVPIIGGNNIKGPIVIDIGDGTSITPIAHVVIRSSKRGGPILIDKDRNKM